MDILDQVPLEQNAKQGHRNGLTQAEKSILVDGIVIGTKFKNSKSPLKENKSNQHMLAMIFKFFLLNGQQIV